jgi:hypothetical protein
MQKVRILGYHDDFKKDTHEISPEGFMVKKEFKESWKVEDEAG